MHQLWDQLGFDEILEKLFASRHHQIPLERLIFAMVANRALHPSSKLAVEDWVQDEVYIPDLLEVASHQLYRAMDELLAVQSELERQVFYSVADLLNLEVDLLYFDTISSYFEVDPAEAPEDETFRKQGFSKDKRPDLLQVVIGLAVTREGIPIRAWVWPGNTMDMTVIGQVKKDLIGWKLGRVVSVMDRRFSSEENLGTLQQAGGHYIVGEKMRSGKTATEPPGPVSPSSGKLTYQRDHRWGWRGASALCVGVQSERSRASTARAKETIGDVAGGIRGAPAAAE